MPPKKQARKKLDLTNLAALNTGATPEPEQTLKEPPTPEPPTPEPEKTPTEPPTPEPKQTLKEQPTPEPKQTLKEQPTPESEQTLKEPPTPESEQAPTEQPTPALVTPPVPPQKEPEPAPVEEAAAERRQFDKKPQRAEVRSLKTIDSATNATGESFKPGDKIQILAPWGKIAIAEITMIYQDESRNAWAQYLPLEDIPANWNWFGGCTRAELLISAE